MDMTDPVCKASNALSKAVRKRTWKTLGLEGIGSVPLAFLATPLALGATPAALVANAGLGANGMAVLLGIAATATAFACATAYAGFQSEQKTVRQCRYDLHAATANARDGHSQEHTQTHDRGRNQVQGTARNRTAAQEQAIAHAPRQLKYAVARLVDYP